MHNIFYNKIKILKLFEMLIYQKLNTELKILSYVTRTQKIGTDAAKTHFEIFAYSGWLICK